MSLQVDDLYPETDGKPMAGYTQKNSNMGFTSP